MKLSNPQFSYGLFSGVTAQSVNSNISGTIGTPTTPSGYTGTPTIAYSLVLQIADGDTLRLDTGTGAVTGAPTPVYQVETATVVAAAGCTSNGTCNVVVAGAHITGSPLTVPVALTTATHTSAALIATAIRSALQDSTIANPDGYTTGGTGTNIVVTDTSYRANDTTLNIAIPAGLGITAAATSANTTAGVAESKAYRINGQAWNQTDFEGVALPLATMIYSILLKSDAGSDVEISIEGIPYQKRMLGAYTYLESQPEGFHQWQGQSVDFAASADSVIYLDIHAGE